ncbi:MAG: T9SS type A sorting domain-containing protein [Bacteroidia bacterium]|nr:T9SS type A sorting domain-containing protein [Bacteroidia bacterium]
MKKLYFLLFIIGITFSGNSQPWLNDLVICQSSDGLTFTNQTTFVDSSGVPSLVMDTNGVLYCAFQWFQPPIMTGPHFDKIAVKKSTDGGLTWTTPVLAVFNGIGTYTRPFDPTLVLTDNGMIRMYFTSSITGNTILDTTIHTYSAISSDGVNYTWEPGIRVLVADSINIDPAVVKFNGLWHYTAPRGAPQAGAFHFTSTDGLNFVRTTNVASDASHNWTGNLLTDGSLMKFYGHGGLGIWSNSTADGSAWNGYQPTNVTGGDPAVIKVNSSLYYMVYVGTVPPASVSEFSFETNTSVFPNPTSEEINFKLLAGEKIIEGEVYDYAGKKVFSFYDSDHLKFPAEVESGIYFVKVKTGERSFCCKVMMERD